MIGHCIQNTDGSYTIQRAFFRQGEIFKDSYAYENYPAEPCYVAENSDKIYSANDILRICDNNKEIADAVFDMLDWQHVESELEDLIASGEYEYCQSCGRLFPTYTHKGYPVKNCPFCNAKYLITNIG